MMPMFSSSSSSDSMGFARSTMSFFMRFDMIQSKIGDGVKMGMGTEIGMGM